MTTHYDFRCACDGLLRDIEDACIIEWLPYRGNLSTEAYRQTRIVVRLARRLGLLTEDREHHDDPLCGCRGCRAAEVAARELQDMKAAEPVMVRKG